MGSGAEIGSAKMGNNNARIRILGQKLTQKMKKQRERYRKARWIYSDATA
jgi:hypothetical protein